jgi:hypothetical protein
MLFDLISRSALIKDIRFTQGLIAGKSDWLHGYVTGLSGAIDAVTDAPAVGAVEVGNCDGCHWKEIGRQQKCSCCRRNRYLKDCYEAKMEG